MRIRREMWAAILNDLPATLPPASGECYTEYELTMGTCWKEIGENFSIQSVPCNTICCSKKYKVCKDATTGEKTATPQAGFGWGWPPCSESDPGEGCTDYCQLLDDDIKHEDEGGFPPHGKVAREDKKQRITGLRITPNPTDGKGVVIAFESSMSTHAQLRVLDAEGSLVRTLDVSLTVGPMSVNVDLTGEAPGVYFTEIRSGRDVLAGGSIHLVR